ncbi:MAG TPA: YdeI/OmpD-associated family protein [Puia sp.]|nr:YdeI/OmpD-associated family protein [Puia sp.]
MNSKVDAFLSTATKWQREMEKLRTIVLDCGLTEELKWGKPCYTFEGKNVVVIQGFKEYCALLFLKGSLLSNADGLLVKTGENTIVGRQARFTNVREVTDARAGLKAAIYEAIEVEKAGIKPAAREKAAIKVPAELQARLNKTAALKKAFQALTPGRQRGYIFYFSQPKQAKTREARIEKCVKDILAGRGLND